MSFELTNERAIRYWRNGKAAQDLAKAKEMVRDLLHLKEEQVFRDCLMLYIMDMSYPRSDIAYASKTVAYERGWSIP